MGKANAAKGVTGAKKKLVESLNPNARNPRSITDAKLKQLGKSMDAFGDISGIVFNVRDGVVYGGTQRTKNLPKAAKVVITKSYEKPTDKGTVAVGYIEHNGERFNYREVDWDNDKAEAAMIAANKSAGEWDKKKLTDSMRRLGDFDLNFDMDLTMFDSEEIRKKFSTVTVSEHQRSHGEDEEESEPTISALPGKTYLLGPHRMTVGNGVPAADVLFKAWEKATGYSPVLLEEDGTEIEGHGGGDGPKPLARVGKIGKTKKPAKVGFSALSARA